MIIYLRLLQESFGFAWNALRNNKLRTLLSLLGVTIGIFSIIAVLAAVDSLDHKIKKDLSSLDKNTIYLFKFPFGESEIPRWKLEQFPNVSFDEFEYLKRNIKDIEGICYQLFVGNEVIKFEDETLESIGVIPTCDQQDEIEKIEFEEGRFFNESESNSGAQVVVIGHDIAKELFGTLNPIGKKVRLYGQKFLVIGVMKKQGAGFFGDSNDNNTYIPVNFMRNRFGDNNDTFMPAILIKPVDGVDIDAFKGELKQKLRSYRGLKVNEMDNFFINLLAGFTDLIDGIIGQMNVVGWIIAGFSLLVGGFGIANIMFVSVKERTNLIGVQKSLGAKNKFILLQFLFEAVILCVIGGLIGILLVWIISLVLTKALDFEFILSFSNVLFGTFLAAIIGLIAGILPAITASKLDPVEAIRSGM